MCRSSVARRFRLSKYQLSELRQVPPPYHPGVHAWCFDVGVFHAFGRKPLAQIAVQSDQIIFGAAGDPESVQLLIVFGVESWKVCLKVFGKAARTESADPGKFIEIVQTGEKGF